MALVKQWTLASQVALAMKLDPIDLRILDAVQRDGSITKLALAEKVGLSPTP
jgi:Lrp/AsnC family transcriptional regulator of ectoine degradation